MEWVWKVEEGPQGSGFHVSDKCRHKSPPHSLSITIWTNLLQLIPLYERKKKMNDGEKNRGIKGHKGANEVEKENMFFLADKPNNGDSVPRQ